MSKSKHLNIHPPHLQTDLKCRDRNDPVYRAALEKECGSLGIMDVPSGNLESEVRHCANHPLGRDPNFEAMLSGSSAMRNEHAPANILAREKSVCSEIVAPFGCDRGYCWKQCGSFGQWCWSAHGDGYGPWAMCHHGKDCSYKSLVCGASDRKDGGCSCSV